MKQSNDNQFKTDNKSIQFEQDFNIIWYNHYNLNYNELADIEQ